MTQKMLNVTEAKRDFLQLVRDVAAGGESVVLLRNGKPVAQLCEIGEQDISRHGVSADAPPKQTAYGILAAYTDASKREQEKDAWRKACEVKHARTA